VATCVISATASNVIPVREETNRDDERSLVQRAQNGDEQAFATLFQSHKKRVYSVCLLMTKDVADAEDLTQEAFLQVFRSVGFVPRRLRLFYLAVSGGGEHCADEVAPSQSAANPVA